MDELRVAELGFRVLVRAKILVVVRVRIRVKVLVRVEVRVDDDLLHVLIRFGEAK